MCGRYHQAAPPERLGREYDLDIRDNFPARYNIAPTDPISVIRSAGAGKRGYALMRWGLIPSWAKGESLKRFLSKPCINARADGVGEKATFRAAFERRRCLIPATGFYEWRAEAYGKQPWCIQRTDDRLFSFAGLWETGYDGEGGEIDTACIITTDAGDDIRPLHDREPAVIQPADYARWLETKESDARWLSPLLFAPAKGFWRLFPVSKAVNSVRNDGPQLLTPLAAG
jgi:putative SOS response-associated peptidase YedK